MSRVARRRPALRPAESPRGVAPRNRSAEPVTAIGVWVGIAGGGAVLGMFASGLLLEYFSWQSFFGLNVGLATLAAIGVFAVVPGSADENPPALDLIGAVLSLVAVGGTVFGIIEGPDRGWNDAATLGSLFAGIAAAVAFVIWELRTDHPMLDPRLFRVRGFSAGTLTITIQFFAAFGFFFVALQYLQFVTDRSPIEAALAMLPMPFVLLPIARNVPKVMDRVGFRRLGPVGLLFMAAGFLVFAQLDLDTPYWIFAGGIVLFAIEMGLAGTPATTAITGSLPRSKQGVASAVNDTARELGSAFGIAILGSVLNQGYRDGLVNVLVGLPANVAERVQASIAFTSSPAIAQFGERGKQLVLAAQQAFVDDADELVVADAALRAPAEA